MTIYQSLDAAEAWASAFATSHRMPYYVYYLGNGWRVTPKKPETGLYYVFHPLPTPDSEAISDDLSERHAGAWE